MIQTVAGNLVRYTVKDIERQIAAFTFLGQLLAINTVPCGHCPEAEVYGPQGGHKESVLVHSFGVEVDQSVQGGPASLIDGVVFGIDAVQQALEIHKCILNEGLLVNKVNLKLFIQWNTQ